MSEFKLRAWWAHRQGLLSRSQAQPHEILSSLGWARGVGGSNIYHVLFSRGGISREQADASVETQKVQELPSVRGCTYFIPHSDFGLALRLGQGKSDASAMRTAVNFLGVTQSEIDELMKKVESVLQDGPSNPANLKSKLGDAVRHLGDEGKKRGQTTTLPLALGFLQTSGRIRRIPVGGRLDAERYDYAIWDGPAIPNMDLTDEEIELEFAKKYFRWIGPASESEFRWLSGFSAKSAKRVMSELKLVPIEPGSDLMLPLNDKESFDLWDAPSDPVYRFISNLDNLVHLRRNVVSLIDPSNHDRPSPGDKKLGSVSGLSDLDTQAIIDRGEIIGLWEFDPEKGEIAYQLWRKEDDSFREELELTQQYIREQLGDFRSFSLDSPASRKPRIDFLRNSS